MNIYIQPLPDGMTDEALADLARAATALAERVLDLPPGFVSTLFPADRLAGDASREIAIKIEGAPEKPARVDGQLYRLSRNLGEMVEARFPAAREVTCSVHDTSGRRRGFWSSLGEDRLAEGSPKVTVTTPAISCVDTNSRSVLPTGALKLENGQLLQEACIIVHRPGAGEAMGLQSNVWLPVPDELAAAIRGS